MNRRTLLFAGGVVIAAGGGGYYLNQDGNNNGLQGVQNGGNNGPQRGMSDPVTVVREYRRLINEAQEQASQSNLTTPVARDIGEQLWPLIHSAAAPEADDYSNLPPDIDAVVIEHEKINIVERGLPIGEINEKYNFGNLGYYEDNSLAENAIVRVTYPSDRIDHFLTVTENGAWVIAALNEFTE
jgi:hypothetical protein